MTVEAFLKLMKSQKAAGKLHTPGRRMRKGSLEAFQKKRPKQTVPADLLALYQSHNGLDLMKKTPTQYGALRLYSISQWKSARGWWNYRGGGVMEDPSMLDGTIIGQHTTPSSSYAWRQSQIVLAADGSRYFILAWGGPRFEVATSLEQLLDWLAEQLADN
jgi:hypothetical protein